MANIEKFLENNPITIDIIACLGYAIHKKREGWYNHGDSTERISG